MPVFKRALRHSKVLLLVDGLDEGYSYATSIKEAPRQDQIAFVQATGSAVICTSRPRGFGGTGVPDDWNTSVIAPLDDGQVHDLAARWFSVTDIGDEADTTDDIAQKQGRDRAEMFLRAAKEHRRTSDLVRNPLLCHAMIELYRLSHRIPEARVGIYNNIIELLLSQHPAARAHAAYTETPVKSLGLQERDLREILVRIADCFQNNIPTDSPNGSQCRSICESFLEDETYGLGLGKPMARRLAKDIIEQLIAQYVLLVERSPDDIGFVHLSIQEYLAAETVTRKSEIDQLNWIERVWLQPKWRECVTNWFGIHGAHANKGLTGQAARRLRELGDAGEWQRLQSLELRIELACRDFGIPVSESRKAVREAIQSVETSPFPSHRKALAHYITIGAVDSSVREECAAALRRWVPGRPSYSRASLLESFKSWKVADDLRESLLRGLHEEHVHCRLAALSSLVKVFGSWSELGPILYELAVHDPRPEIRAIGLKGLGKRAEWADMALAAASANLQTSSAELLLSACEVRVFFGRHDENDLQRMWRLWSARAVTYWQVEVFTDVLCSGWPTHMGLREAFTDALQHNVSSADREVGLQYLVRCYPYDDEIGSLVAGLFDQFDNHIATDMGLTWTALIGSYRGHEEVAAAVRRALRKHKEEFEAIHWHPQTIPGQIVIGDKTARDELLEAYLTIEPDMGRYWIAKTLFDGWSDDEDVRTSLTEWCTRGADAAAPLASWASELYPDVSERREWLEQLVEMAPTRLIWMCIRALLDEFPDDQSRRLVEKCVQGSNIWYYHLIRIRGHLARHFPNLPSSQNIVRCALNDIDGPQLSDFAASYENHPTFRSAILSAAVPVSEEVRTTVAATLRDRALNARDIEYLTPSVFAEESGPIRTMAVIARARATKGNDEAVASLSDALIRELRSLGTFLETRKCTALAGLIELGQSERAVSTLADEARVNWHRCLPDSMNRDTVSLGVIIDKWHVVKPLLAAAEIEPDLPIAQLVSHGYGAMLEQGSLTREALDDHLKSNSLRHEGTNYFIEMARRFPRTNFLKEQLIGVFRDRDRKYSPSHVSTHVVARLLVDHFKKDADALSKLTAALHSLRGDVGTMQAGLLALFAFGWPESDFGRRLRSIPDSEIVRWPVGDRLLCAVALGDKQGAEQASALLLSEPLENWRYKVQDV